MEAVVLHQSPNLIHDSISCIKDERASQQIRQLIKREKMQSTYRKVEATLSPNLRLGISCTDVPDRTAKGAALGDSHEPKTWKGPWITLTNPTEIAQVIK